MYFDFHNFKNGGVLYFIYFFRVIYKKLFKINAFVLNKDLPTNHKEKATYQNIEFHSKWNSLEFLFYF